MAEAILGIDVSKKKLDVTLLFGKDQKRHKVFDNTSQGSHLLLEWTKRYTQETLHVCTECTGIYDEAVAEFFYQAAHRVSRLNPMAVKAFGQSMMTRTKTDAKDSFVIAQFCKALSPVLWKPETLQVKIFKDFCRSLETLKDDYQRLVGRMETSQAHPDRPSYRLWKGQTEALVKTIQFLEENIRTWIQEHPELVKQCELLQTIPGIGEKTAWKILSEIPGLENFQNARQLAAYAGLTPRQRQSGSSLHKQSRLSKMGSARLRKALYFPALVATRHNPLLVTFFKQLTQKGKSKMTAIGACMRKLIHIVFGVLKNSTPFNPHILLDS